MTTKDVPDAPENNPDWMDVPTFISNKPFASKQKPKLTPADVRMIRNSCINHTELAFIHGVSKSTIQSVKRKRTWRNV